MNIPFQGQISQNDLTRITALALKNQRWMSYVFGPFCVFFLALLVNSLRTNTFNLFWVVIVVFAGFMASYPFWGPAASARSAYQSQAEMRGAFSGEIRDEEIYLQTSQQSRTIQWTRYAQLLRDPNTVLLFQSPRCFDFFPRSFFATEAAWQEFQSFLDRKIAQGEIHEQGKK